MNFKISAKTFIYCQIVYNCIIKFLVVDFHFPSALNYVSDIFTIAALFMVLRKNHFGVHKRSPYAPIRFATLLVFFATLSAFLSADFSPILYIWSLRNNYRIFIFFYCCCKTLDEEDVHNIFEILEKILYANIVVCVFEYFVRGMEYDFLGGLYGNGIQGGNGPLNALMIIVCAYLIVEYINKNKKIWNLLFGIGGCLFIATVGELKFFYFEIVLLVVLICVFVTHNLRMAVFITAIAVIGVVGMSFYVRLYPHRAGFLSLVYIQEYSKNNSYGVSTEINRLTAINIISTNYFDMNWKKILLGLGMGNGEFSSQYSFLTSEFYSLHSIRLRYDWFVHSFMFVETGYIGLALYVLSYVSAMIKAWWDRKDNTMNQIAMISIAFLIIMIFYNQVLRIESVCYMAAFVLAIPYINAKGRFRERRMRVSV